MYVYTCSKIGIGFVTILLKKKKIGEIIVKPEKNMKTLAAVPVITVTPPIF